MRSALAVREEVAPTSCEAAATSARSTPAILPRPTLRSMAITRWEYRTYSVFVEQGAQSWLDGLNLTGIHWVIAGGESGPRARPMDPQWVVGLRDVCSEAEVPFFFKQWGGRTPKAGGRLLDGQTYDEMPERLAVSA